MRSYKGNNQLASDTKSFEIQGGIFPTTLLSYMDSIYESHSYVYCATMLSSVNQGAIPDCSRDAFSKYEIESRNIDSICINGRWTMYTGRSDISAIQKQFDKVGGIDFVFSPVIVLGKFFAKDIIVGGTFLTALKFKSFLCVAVFNQTQLLYSSFMQIKTAGSEKVASADTTESTFEDFFDDDSVHSLGGDGMMELDDLSVNLDDETSSTSALSTNIEDEAFREKNLGSIMSLESTGSDLRLADFIKDSLSEFYKNPLYQASFIDKILIADPICETTDSKDILENELMMSVEIEKIPVSMLLCQMAIDEASS
jgi:hypothetical protein